MREIPNRKFVLASHNKGKLREFTELLSPFGYEIVSAAELGLAEGLQLQTNKQPALKQRAPHPKVAWVAQ